MQLIYQQTIFIQHAKTLFYKVRALYRKKEKNETDTTSKWFTIVNKTAIQPFSGILNELLSKFKWINLDNALTALPCNITLSP